MPTTRLEPAALDVESALAAAPPTWRSRRSDWRSQNQSLHRAFDPVLDEPIPARLTDAVAAGACIRAVWRPCRGGGLARARWCDRLRPCAALRPQQAELHASLLRQAAIAHAVFAAEVRHPVEVGADQEAHLAGLALQARSAHRLKPPALSVRRLRPGGRAPPARRSGSGRPVHVPGHARPAAHAATSVPMPSRQPGDRLPPRASEGKVGVFYWLDGELGYALSGELAKDDRCSVATPLFYRQLNP
ncbi:MAG: hypothetical protein MZW92_05170 [Comamonadaceae bacterium]|nr:hypothetical protein [Comamonadaceae bacterium]